VVLESDERCEGFVVGDRVVFNPVNPSRQEEVLGHSVDGIFSETVRMSIAHLRAGMLMRLNPDVDGAVAPLVEPLGAAIYGIELARRTTSLNSAVVLGAGPIGLLIATVLRLHGCRVYLVNRSTPRLKWVASSEIVDAATVLCAAGEVVERVDDETAGRGVDAVFVCTQRVAVPGALEVAKGCIRDEGTIDFPAGAPADDGRFQETASIINSVRRENVCGRTTGPGAYRIRGARGDAIVTGHRGTSAAHLRRAMDLLAARDEFRRIVTHRLDFEAAPDAINRLASGTRLLDGRLCMKVVINVGGAAAGA
jgi:threonine dehydrogenase-like Zn-dependent dehydrogenase